MPDPGDLDLVPRDGENPAVEHHLGEFAGHVNALLQFSARVFGWSTRIEGHGDYVVPSFFMFRHMLDLLGALSVQIRRSWIDPADATLRALFEACLYSNYLVRDDHQNRGYSFLVWSQLKEIRNLQRFDPESQSGQQFKRKIENDRLVHGVHYVPPFDVRERIRNLKAGLEKTQYRAAKAEYDHLVEGGRKHPIWYEFFNHGTTTIEILANRMGMSGIYEVIYRSLSGTTHASSILAGKMSATDEGQLLIQRLRSPKAAQQLTLLGTSLALESTTQYLNHHTPDRMPAFNEWWLGWRAMHMRLSGEPMIEIQEGRNGTAASE